MSGREKEEWRDRDKEGGREKDDVEEEKDREEWRTIERKDGGRRETLQSGG